PQQLKHPPLQWTCKNTRQLANELCALKHRITQRSLVGLLHQLEFDLRGKHKRPKEHGPQATNGQFRKILQSVLEFRRRGQPMVFVEVKNLRKPRNLSAGHQARVEAETARHAIETLKCWWQRRGRRAF